MEQGIRVMDRDKRTHTDISKIITSHKEILRGILEVILTLGANTGKTNNKGDNGDTTKIIIHDTETTQIEQ